MAAEVLHNGIFQAVLGNKVYSLSAKLTGVTAYESTIGNLWTSWGESNLELIAPNGTTIGTWDENDFNFPIREILEYNGEVLFATEDGVARYNETTNQWLSLWDEGNGLPNNAGDRIYELWTDGTNLVVGGGDVSGFGQFRAGSVSHWDGTQWDQYSLGQSGTQTDIHSQWRCVVEF